LAPDILLNSLDPMKIVEGKNGIGGAAPQAVVDSIEHRKAKLKEDRKSLSGKRERVSVAREKLEKAVLDILK
jgi:hypothetical protein